MGFSLGIGGKKKGTSRMDITFFRLSTTILLLPYSRTLQTYEVNIRTAVHPLCVCFSVHVRWAAHEHVKSNRLFPLHLKMLGSFVASLLTQTLLAPSGTRKLDKSH